MRLVAVEVEAQDRLGERVRKRPAREARAPVTEPLAGWNVIVRVAKVYPRAMDDAHVRGYPAVIALTHSPATVQAGQWRR